MWQQSLRRHLFRRRHLLRVISICVSILQSRHRGCVKQLTRQNLQLFDCKACFENDEQEWLLRDIGNNSALKQMKKRNFMGDSPFSPPPPNGYESVVEILSPSVFLVSSSAAASTGRRGECDEARM
jgi:hypothetical protein